MQSGEGCWLTTTDGQRYLDCVSGIATCALGHSNQALNNAVNKQMQTMHHVSNLYFIPAQAALANWLCENSNAEKVFFCNSGAEANEAAIKVARRHASNRGITVRRHFLFYIAGGLYCVPMDLFSFLIPLCRPFVFFVLETRHYFGRTILSRPHLGCLDGHCPTQVPQGIYLRRRNGSWI